MLVGNPLAIKGARLGHTDHRGQVRVIQSKFGKAAPATADADDDQIDRLHKFCYPLSYLSLSHLNRFSFTPGLLGGKDGQMSFQGFFGAGQDVAGIPGRRGIHKSFQDIFITIPMPPAGRVRGDGVDHLGLPAEVVIMHDLT